MINPVSPVISNDRERKRVAPGAPGGNERKRRGKISVPESNRQYDGKPKPSPKALDCSQKSTDYKRPVPPTPQGEITEEQRRETILCSLLEQTIH